MHRSLRLCLPLLVALGGAGCAFRLPAPAVAFASAPAPAAAPADPSLLALTQDHALIRVRASAPDLVLSRVAVKGLAAGDSLVGLDFRVARGVLYTLAASGQLYTLAPDTGVLTPVGRAAAALGPAGTRWGFDFNPAADRIRVVGSQGRNLRLHPDTGAPVDGNPAEPGLQDDAPLRYAEGDAHQGWVPQVAAAAYSYHQKDDKLTTNYAIDTGLGLLVRQGSLEGVQPVVSPNTGLLFTVGPLGLRGPLEDAALDVADVHNQALAALRSAGVTRLYRVDLASGRAQALGRLADGAPLRGLAIEP
ncbi:hypothetical protein BurJ1DRAFT_0805 [Burkholderiales bacterium JOSHI_001]|nr:hypothetical protein BurJ1DRAFT_0805 [Burkholderiales bacterium JOSHI_001]